MPLDPPPERKAYEAEFLHVMSIPNLVPDSGGQRGEVIQGTWKSAIWPQGQRSVILRVQECEVEPREPVLWTELEKSSGEDF